MYKKFSLLMITILVFNAGIPVITYASDVPVEQAVAEENGFADFDLDPVHYTSAAAFANAVLKEAESYGHTKKAEALLQTAYAIWPNPRFLAAEEELIRSQWKETARYTYYSDEESYQEFYTYEYNDAGDLIREIYWYRSDELALYAKKSDGSPLDDYYIEYINEKEYDKNHHIISENNLDSWFRIGNVIDNGYYMTLSEMEEILATWPPISEDGIYVASRKKYDYDETGRIIYNYDVINGEETLYSWWEYDPNGRLSTEHYSSGASWIYEYNSDGSLVRDAKINADGSLSVESLYYYDEYGQRIREENYDSEGNTISARDFYYDLDGRMISYYWDSGSYTILNESGNFAERYNVASKYTPETHRMYESDYSEAGYLTEIREYRDNNLKTKTVYEYIFFPLEEAVEMHFQLTEDDH